MSKRQPILIENVRTSYNLAMRSLYVRCSFLKPRYDAGGRLETPLCRFATGRVVLDGQSGVARGLKAGALLDWFEQTQGPAGRALISADPPREVPNYNASALVHTAGRTLEGFELDGGEWADYDYVRILRPIVPIRIIDEKTVADKPLVIADRGYTATLEGGIPLTFALTTGRWFRDRQGCVWFEAETTRNNEAYVWRATVSWAGHVPQRFEFFTGEQYYSASGEQVGRFTPPDLLWFRLNRSVVIEGIGSNDTVTDAWLDEQPDGNDGNGGGGGNSPLARLAAALMLGLALNG